MLHRYIKHIAVKYPCLFIFFKFKYNFVNDAKRSHPEPGKLSQHLIVISGDVICLYAFAHPTHQMFDDLHVAFWPIPFTELPYVNNITIQNNSLRLNTSQILKQFFCVTSIRSQMNIGNYNNIDFSFFTFHNWILRYLKGE